MPLSSPKLAMDYTVTPKLYEWITTSYGFAGISIIAGTYVGLRTGAFECGFSYVTFSKSTLSKMSVDEATAFGIGFGAFEAILIAVPSLIQIAAFTLNPALLGSIPSPQREMLEAQLGLPTWIVAAPLIERIFTMFAHVFAALLVFVSVARRKHHFFVEGFFYKGLLDAAVPYIQTTFKPGVSPTGIYLAEVWVAAMGLIALTGTRWARKTMFKSE